MQRQQPTQGSMLGDNDSWKGGMVRSVERIIRRSDQLYIYYCCVHGAHTGPKNKQVVRKHLVQIGLLTQRRDGFISLDAGEQQRTILTKPSKLPGAKLFFNVDAPRGELHVGVLDGDGIVARFESLTGDLPREPTMWIEGDIADLKGQIVSLRFTLRNGQFYSKDKASHVWQ